MAELRASSYMLSLGLNFISLKFETRFFASVLILALTHLSAWSSNTNPRLRPDRMPHLPDDILLAIAVGIKYGASVDHRP